MAVATSTLVALGLAAAAAGTQYYNTKQTAKRQDREMARGIDQRAARQRDADTEVNALIDKTKLSNADDARSNATKNFLQTIMANKGNATAGLNQQGAVSKEYQTAANDAALGITDYGTKTADLLARIDAPMQQRQQEGVDRGRFAESVDRIRRFSSGDEYLHNLRLRGIQLDPRLTALSSVLGGASSAAGAGGWGTTTAAPQGAVNYGNTFFTNGGLAGIGF